MSQDRVQYQSASRALTFSDIQAIWQSLFSDNAPTELQGAIRSLRAAACGHDHALLAAGPRIECDALLQIAREHAHALNSVYALSRELPVMYFSFLPSDDFLYIRPVKAQMPGWMSQQDTSSLLIVAIRGPRAATLVVSDELNRLIDEKVWIPVEES
jgi:hypothetical protein